MYQTPINGPEVTTIYTVQSIGDDYTPGSRSGSWAVDDARCNRTYTNRIKVNYFGRGAGPMQAMADTGAVIGMYYYYPFIGGASEIDTGSYLTSMSAELASEDGRTWLVTLEYTPFDVWSLLGSSDIQSGIINPLDRALEVYWGEPAKYRKSKPYDESGPNEETGLPGAPYVNTIGDPLLNPPETEESRPVLFIVRNESTYNDAYASQYKDTVNSNVAFGFPPNTVKCRDIQGGQRAWDPDWGWFFRVTYQFEFDYDDDGEGFTQLILNAGYRQKVNGAGSPVNVLDANGNPVTDAVPLQESGAYVPNANPVFIPFQEFPQVDFTGLNIPDDILYIAAGNS